jgi:acyl-coenzyme A synthetase/AMP-(fatty) acid ligase
MPFLRIFSAGMIAVPMDPTFSDERKLRIIETTNMRCFFAPPTVESIRADIPVFAVNSCGKVVKREGISTCSSTEPSFDNAGDIAYAMCTSGTTGDPKIIWVPHKCAQANLVSFGLDYFQELGPEAVVAQVAPLTFDPSIIEIFLALNSGSRLAIFSKAVIADPLLLSRCLSRSKPTFLQCTPSFARRIGSTFSDVLSSESLQYMCFGGEIFPDVLELQKWTSTLSPGRISQLAFFNLYGVTEVSIWATVEEIPCELLRKAPPGTAISIGDPLCRTELLLVDAASQKPLFLINYSSEGTFETLNHERFGQMDLYALSQAALANQTVLDPMELYIGGLNRECYLDEEKVCRRWVKSGDHVRRVENRLFFLGRRDGVVKRSGKRFHPEEVTAIIRKCPFVEDGLVWIDEASNDLNATVVLHQEDQQTALFHRWIVANVPDYMRPDRMITTGEAIPLNTNGKPDKVAFKMLSCSEFCRDLFLRFGHPDLDSKTHLVSHGATSIDIAQAARQFVNMFLLGDPEVIPRVQNIILHTPSDEMIDSLSLLVTKPSQVEMKPGPIERVVGQLDADVVDLVYSASRKRYGISVSPSSIETGQSEFRIKWRAFLGKCIDAAPLLASLSTEEDVCFIASHSGVISCIDVQSGVPVWTKVFDDRSAIGALPIF